MTRRQLLAVFPCLGLATCGVRPHQHSTSPRLRAATGELTSQLLPTLAPLPEPPPARPVDASPQRILVIGDSMVHGLLPVLADYCLENGHSLHPAMWWGSTSSGWAVSRKLDQLLARHRPTFVVVVLGSSEVLGTGIEPIVTRAARRLLTRIGDRKLVWLGPPPWRRGKHKRAATLARANQGAAAVTRALRQALGSGRVFDPSELAFERQQDGIHPTPAGGRAWAEQLIVWLRDDSDHPIALRPPTRKAKLPHATCYGAAWEQQTG